MAYNGILSFEYNDFPAVLHDFPLGKKPKL